jgi:hypothetical protein
VEPAGRAVARLWIESLPVGVQKAAIRFLTPFSYSFSYCLLTPFSYCLRHDRAWIKLILFLDDFRALAYRTSAAGNAFLALALRQELAA